MKNTNCQNNSHSTRQSSSRQEGRILRAFRVTTCVLALAACPRVRAQRDASGVAAISNGAVVSIIVTDGGSGYAVPPGVTFVGGGGSGAAASTELFNGVVTNIGIQTVGTGYTSAPFV